MQYDSATAPGAPGNSPGSGLSVIDDNHAHRWRIDEQQGPQSAGHCVCGQEKDFTNGWDPASGWLIYREAKAAR